MSQNQVYGLAVLSNREESTSSNCPKSANFSAKLKDSSVIFREIFYLFIVLCVRVDSKGYN